MSREKTDSISISIRLPQSLHAKVTLIAKSQTRSISQQIVHFLREAIGEEVILMAKAEGSGVNYKPPPEEGDAEKQLEG